MQKVLIIDDSPLVHTLLGVRLKDEPILLESAMDGESGLARAESFGPDLILLDVEMPGVDGFEVCRRLKASKVTGEIPVILLTSATAGEEKIRGLELGAIDYISKPFDEAEVKARVRAGLRVRCLLDLLASKAMLDGLTGLWNRAYFEHRLQQEISLARRTGRPLGCLMVNVDHVGKINETHGHPGGDEVLCAVGRLLANNCRIEDVVCRVGGDEFGIVAPNTRADGCSDLAGRLLRTITNTDIVCRGGVIRVTLSFGGADMETAGADYLVDFAQKALGRAKHGGRNRVEVHKPPMAA